MSYWIFWFPKNFWSLKPFLHIFSILHFHISGAVICLRTQPQRIICIDFDLVYPFCNKVLNRFFVFWIYPQATLLPVQNTSHVFSCQVLFTIEQQFSLPMLQLAGMCYLFSSLLTLSNIIFLSLCVFCHLHYFYYFLCILHAGLKLIHSSLHICRFFK